MECAYFMIFLDTPTPILMYEEGEESEKGYFCIKMIIFYRNVVIR